MVPRRCAGQVGAPITCVADHGDLTYVAAGRRISQWSRGKLRKAYPEHVAAVLSMFMFGGNQLLTLAENNTLHVYDVDSGGAWRL